MPDGSSRKKNKESENAGCHVRVLFPGFGSAFWMLLETFVFVLTAYYNHNKVENSFEYHAILEV